MLFGLIGVKLLALANSEGTWLAAAMLVPIVLLARFASVGLPAIALRGEFRWRWHCRCPISRDGKHS